MVLTRKLHLGTDPVCMRAGGDISREWQAIVKPELRATTKRELRTTILPLVIQPRLPPARVSQRALVQNARRTEL